MKEEDLTKYIKRDTLKKFRSLKVQKVNVPLALMLLKNLKGKVQTKPSGTHRWHIPTQVASPEQHRRPPKIKIKTNTKDEKSDLQMDI